MKKTIPAIAINILSFPGVIVRELVQQLFCRLFGVPVFQVVYFQLASPGGYVLHERPLNKWHSLIICIAPVLVCTITGALIALPAALPVFTFHHANPIHYLLIWLGISVAMHAFPSKSEAVAVWNGIKEPGTQPLLKLIGFPLMALIYLGSLASMIWLDLAYGIAVAIGLPNLIIQWLM